MTQRGFALITVLWVVATLSVLGGVTLAAGRVGGKVGANRLYLTRAGWAREACLEIVRARLAADSLTRAVDTVELGRGTWCRATLEDPAERIHLNTADEPTLMRLFGDVQFVAALLDWRDADDMPRASGAEAAWYRERRNRLPRNAPLADVDELQYVRGFRLDIGLRSRRFATTRGDGSININAAPVEVLGALSFLPEGAAGVLVMHRAAGRMFRTHDEASAVLSEAGLPIGFSEYRAFASTILFAAETLVARVEGGVRGTPLVSGETTVLGRVSGGWTVTHREVE